MPENTTTNPMVDHSADVGDDDGTIAAIGQNPEENTMVLYSFFNLFREMRELYNLDLSEMNKSVNLLGMYLMIQLNFWVKPTFFNFFADSSENDNS